MKKYLMTALITASFANVAHALPANNAKTYHFTSENFNPNEVSRIVYPFNGDGEYVNVSLNDDQKYSAADNSGMGPSFEKTPSSNSPTFNSQIDGLSDSGYYENYFNYSSDDDLSKPALSPALKPVPKLSALTRLSNWFKTLPSFFSKDKRAQSKHVRFAGTYYSLGEQPSALENATCMSRTKAFFKTGWASFKSGVQSLFSKKKSATPQKQMYSEKATTPQKKMHSAYSAV